MAAYRLADRDRSRPQGLLALFSLSGAQRLRLRALCDGRGPRGRCGEASMARQAARTSAHAAGIGGRMSDPHARLIPAAVTQNKRAPKAPFSGFDCCLPGPPIAFVRGGKRGPHRVVNGPPFLRGLMASRVTKKCINPKRKVY